jgi:uncharacterized protein YukE
LSEPEIAVDLGGVFGIAEQLEEILAALEKSLSTLHESVAKHVAGWEGEARDACTALLSDWSRQMDDLSARQRWLHHVVTTGHANYTATHQGVLRGWGAA